jgi:hypothetical protein
MKGVNLGSCRGEGVMRSSVPKSHTSCVSDDPANGFLLPTLSLSFPHSDVPLSCTSTLPNHDCEPIILISITTQEIFINTSMVSGYYVHRLFHRSGILLIKCTHMSSFWLSSHYEISFFNST